MKQFRGLLLSFLLQILILPATASAGFCEEGRASAFDYYELGPDAVDPRETLSLLQACIDESGATTERLSERILLARFGLKVARDTRGAEVFAQVWEALQPVSMLSSVPARDRATALLLRAQWREFAPQLAYDMILRDASSKDVAALCGTSLDMDAAKCFAARAAAPLEEELSLAVQLDPTVAHAAAVQKFILRYRLERTWGTARLADLERLLKVEQPATLDLLRLVQNNPEAEAVCGKLSQQSTLACIALAKAYVVKLRTQNPSPAFELDYVKPTLASWAKAVVQTRPEKGQKDAFVSAGHLLFAQTERAWTLAKSQDGSDMRMDLMDLVWTDGATLAVALLLAPAQERDALRAKVGLTSDELVFKRVEEWLDPVLGDSPYTGIVYRDVATRATVKVLRLMKLWEGGVLTSSPDAPRLFQELDKILAVLPDPAARDQREWLEGPAPVNSVDVALLTFARAAAAELRLAMNPTRTGSAQAVCDARSAHAFYVGDKDVRRPRSGGAEKIDRLRWIEQSNAILNLLDSTLHTSGCTSASSP